MRKTYRYEVVEQSDWHYQQGGFRYYNCNKCYMQCEEHIQ
jgi:hypothetical protein